MIVDVNGVPHYVRGGKLYPAGSTPPPDPRDGAPRCLESAIRLDAIDFDAAEVECENATLTQVFEFPKVSLSIEITLTSNRDDDPHITLDIWAWGQCFENHFEGSGDEAPMRFFDCAYEELAQAWFKRVTQFIEIQYPMGYSPEDDWDM